MPERAAKFLSLIEVQTAEGAEDFIGDDVEKVVGRKPQTFDEWAGENDDGWN
jgi:hypothetical protein